MMQLSILAFSFLLIGWMYHLASRRPRPLPPLPTIEPASASRREELLRDAAQELAWRRLSPLPRDARALRLLRPLLRCSDQLPALSFLRDNGHNLLMPLIATRDALLHAPRLPAAVRGLPRMLTLCRRYLMCGGSMERDLLLDTLSLWQEAAALTLQERLQLPLCVRSALCDQLADVLANLHHAVEEVRRGRNLGRRLIRSHRPMELLNKQHLSLTEAQAMLAYLTECRETTLLTVLEERMRQDNYSMQQLSEDHASNRSCLIIWPGSSPAFSLWTKWIGPPCRSPLIPFTSCSCTILPGRIPAWTPTAVCCTVSGSPIFPGCSR